MARSGGSGGGTNFVPWAVGALVLANIFIWEGVYFEKRCQVHDVAGQSATADSSAGGINACKSCNCSAMKMPWALKKMAAQMGAEGRGGDWAAGGGGQVERRSSKQDEVAPKDSRSIVTPQVTRNTVLILSPGKNCEELVKRYFANLRALSYPHNLISLGIIISDSLDKTFEQVRTHIQQLPSDFRYAQLINRDFGFMQSLDPNATKDVQREVAKREVLARSRNYVLSEVLKDEEWALWLDMDVWRYPATLLQDLLAHQKDILVPNCLLVDDSGKETESRCDLGSWAETPESMEGLKELEEDAPLFEEFPGIDTSRARLGDFRGNQTLVKLDGVGATVLLVRADLHREGLIFPTVLYQHSIEAEGFGKMARTRGYQPIGLPNYIIHHAKVVIPEQPNWEGVWRRRR